jgi:hypothetical protein
MALSLGDWKIGGLVDWQIGGLEDWKITGGSTNKEKGRCGCLAASTTSCGLSYQLPPAS